MTENISKIKVWQKIFPKHRKSIGSSSIIQQKCGKSGQFLQFWSNKFQIKHKKQAGAELCQAKHSLS